MRKPFIAGNWKMNKTTNEAVELVASLKKNLLGFANADIVVCPPFTSLTAVYDVIGDTNIGLGAQNLFWEKEGAYTGEISPIMLKDTGCEYVIIGHSERRQYFGETDETVNKRIDTALAVGLTPIVCIGETLEQREANKTFDVIETQLKGGLDGFAEDDLRQMVIAYEPVWAIGTGKTATNQQAQEVHAYIRKWVENSFSKDVAQEVRILYGGSVKPDNIAGLMDEKDIDGALVGGASLKAASFVDIVKNASKIS